LLYTQLCHARDQTVRDRLIEGKPEIPFLSRVRRNRPFDACVSRDWWIQADVIFESREVQQDAVLP
jgi:hypothetical protein